MPTARRRVGPSACRRQRDPLLARVHLLTGNGLLATRTVPMTIVRATTIIRVALPLLMLCPALAGCPKPTTGCSTDQRGDLDSRDGLARFRDGNGAPIPRVSAGLGTAQRCAS